MTKFKKGDKVVCFEDAGNYVVNNGQEYTVKEVEIDMGVEFLYFNEVDGPHGAYRFQLVEKPTQELGEFIADLQNQLDTWKRIHATDQECIRALMAKSMGFSQHVILPVEEFRRLQNQILDETKYSTHMVANYKQLQKELDQQIEEKLSLMDEIAKMRADECFLSSDEEDEIDRIVKEINDER